MKTMRLNSKACIMMAIETILELQKKEENNVTKHGRSNGLHDVYALIFGAFRGHAPLD